MTNLENKPSSNKVKELGDKFFNDIQNGFVSKGDGNNSFLSKVSNLWGSSTSGKVLEVIIGLFLMLTMIKASSILLIVVSLFIFYYYLIILIDLFNKEMLLGVVGILAPPFAFIYGWIKVDEMGRKELMKIWSIFIIISVVLTIITTLYPCISMSKEMAESIRMAESMMKSYR